MKKICFAALIATLSCYAFAGTEKNSGTLKSRISALENILPIVGPQGEQGPRGEQGPQGLSGQDGEDLFPQVCYLYVTLGIDQLLDGCGPGLVVIECPDGKIVGPEKGCPVAGGGSATPVKWQILTNEQQ